MFYTFLARHRERVLAKPDRFEGPPVIFDRNTFSKSTKDGPCTSGAVIEIFRDKSALHSCTSARQPF